MTEEEWLTNSNPASLLDFLRGKASNRKARLYTVWCCRQCERFPDTRMQAAINLAERLEDASKNELAAVVTGVWEVLTELDPVDSEPYFLPEYVAIELLEDRYSIEDASNNPYSMASYAQARNNDGHSFYGLAEELFIEQTDAVRELFGNPFRPVDLNPRWLTSTVIGIAESIDRHAQYHNMPILADALEDAGCDNPDILTHCRNALFHARGCWVLDLLLGRG